MRNHGTWSGTAPDPSVWVHESVWSLPGVSARSRDCYNKVEVMWAQTSLGTAFLSIATKDPVVSK